MCIRDSHSGAYSSSLGQLSPQVCLSVEARSPAKTLRGLPKTTRSGSEPRPRGGSRERAQKHPATDSQRKR
eukprot:11634530-Alexandrium_andersonii.AAC.1